MMPYGFIVARIRFKDENVYHCIDKYGKHRFFRTKEMMEGLDRGDYLNGTVVDFGSQVYIRLGQGIPTIDESTKNFDRMQFSDYSRNYMKARETTKRCVKAKAFAMKRYTSKPKNKREAAFREEMETEKARRLAASLSANPTGAVEKSISARTANDYAVIGWLLEHPQAARDAFGHIGRKTDDLAALEEDLGRHMLRKDERQALLDWFAAHEQVSIDFVNHFKKSPSEFLG